MTARLASLTGFPPGPDALTFAVDLYYGEKDRWRKLCYDGLADNSAVVVKLTEGQRPISARDKRLARNTYDGALEIVGLAIEHGRAWTVYHYSTPQHDGPRHVDDVELEAEWFLEQLARFEAEVVEKFGGARAKRLRKMLELVPSDSDARKALNRALDRECPNLSHGLRVWLDFEDKTSPLYLANDRQGLVDWAARWLTIVGDALGYDPTFYSFSSYCRHLAKGHGLGRYPLVQAEYDNRDPDRVLESPKMPHGWTTRAGWQFTDDYLEGLDRNVIRMSALSVPRGER